MRIMSLLAAAAITAAAAAAPARAAAIPNLDAPAAGVILVSGGCGYYGHRTPYGNCVPNYRPIYRPIYRACPPGFHLGRFGRRCWPNY